VNDSSGLRTARSGRHLVAAFAVGLVVGALVMIAVWLIFGGGVWRSEVAVHGAELRSTDRLALVVGSCNGAPEVTFLRETDDDVQVGVVASSTPLLGGDDCQDLLEVQLQEPLGDRAVIDKRSGQSVSVTTIDSS